MHPGSLLLFLAAPLGRVPVASRHQLHADSRAASLTVLVRRAEPDARHQWRWPRGHSFGPRPRSGGAPLVTGLSMNAWLQVTFFSGGTDAPDETSKAIG